jgi:hypothetical protein
VCVCVWVCVGLCTVGVYVLIHTYVCMYIQSYVQGVQLKAKPNRSSSATAEMWPAGGERRRVDDIDCCIAADVGRRSSVVNSVSKDIHSSLVCAKKSCSIGCRSTGLAFPLAGRFLFKFPRLTRAFVP